VFAEGKFEMKTYRRVALQEQGWSVYLQEDISPGIGLDHTG